MMDICSIGGNYFVVTWAIISVLGFLPTFLASAVVFKIYYIDITYEKWRCKINPEYPSPKKVRDEIVLFFKGLSFSVLCPAASIYLAANGKSKAYCTLSDSNEYGVQYHLIQFVVITLVSDLYEWYYHRLGHVCKMFWRVHCHHHAFYNPSPFSVISDEYIDQAARALPLLVFPLVAPVSMELMLFNFTIFFYGYGIYLHYGHECVDWLDAHHPVFNTSYQHYIHHAKSIYDKPYHTGFFFKVWDQMAGSVYPKSKCDCITCQREKNGERTREQFEKVVKPDYSVLWKDSSLWWGSVQYDNPHTVS